MKHILMIGTGGTIASEMTPSGLTPELNSTQLLSFVPRIGEMCHVDCVQLYSLDSTNIRPAHWLGVAKAVREKYPVTLTADAALLLARMKDAELAPLETVAEDVGVDPTVYYTTRTLEQAFLDKCDRARMAGFAPLFAGSADAGRAALAALLPNTCLQALVWQALTAPELPEVTEHEDL